jgi:AraC-like DNA-binding protein
MLNDFFITRDVLSYLQEFINRKKLILPEFQKKLDSYALKQHMSFEQWWNLLEQLESIHPIPALGLSVGRNIRVQDCGVLGYLFKTSRNIGDALKCFKRFQGLIYAGSEAQLEIIDNENVRLVWEPDYGYSSQTSDALLIAAMVNIVRELIEPNSLKLKYICFTQAIPSDEMAIYENFFKCEIKQHQAKLSLAFPKTDLLCPIPHEDPTLNNILGKQAENLLAHLPENDDFLVRLRDNLLRCLHEGRSDAGLVAKEMGLSERTLHRRLKNKNRVYRDILKEIRKSMSVNYLSDSKLSLPEVALLLGYSEQSTFSRAFKKWYGIPPLKYKKNSYSALSNYPF